MFEIAPNKELDIPDNISLPDAYKVKQGRITYLFQNCEDIETFAITPESYRKSSYDTHKFGTGGSHDSWSYGSYWWEGSNLKSLKSLKGDLIQGKCRPRILKKFEQMKKEVDIGDIPNPFAPAQRERTRSVDGDEVLIDRALNMDPDCFEARMPSQKIKTVALVMPISASCCMPTEVFINKVILTTLLVDSLEERGYQTKIILNSSANIGSQGRGHRDHRTCVWSLAKDYSEPLDVERILACASPALFRVFGFYWMDHLLQSFNLTAVPFYGSPSWLPSKVEMTEMEGDICLEAEELGTPKAAFMTYAGKINKFLTGEEK